MFGMYGLAEAVNVLCEKAGITGRYGKNEQANALATASVVQLAAFVENTPVARLAAPRQMPHAQSGISSDSGTTRRARPAVRRRTGPVSHLLAVAPHHKHYHLRGSAIFSPSRKTVKRNPGCGAACVSVQRRYAWSSPANVAGNDRCASPGIWCGSPIWRNTGEARSRTNTISPRSARRPRAIPVFWNVSRA